MKFAYTLPLCLLTVLLSTDLLCSQVYQKDWTSDTVLLLEHGVREDGRPTSRWIEAIYARRDKDTIERLKETSKPFTGEEQLWAELIQNRINVWKERIDSLSIPFKEVELPDSVFVLMGNAGGEDAFAYKDSTIGFDLSKLQQIYGSASKPENQDRIDRFFSHEMTHIYHKAWKKEHGIEINSPLEYALWDCLVEGIGNYRSLSNKWVSKEGVLTERAKNTLKELQPIFVERLIALEHATEEESIELLEGLSSGSFTKKWGALTSALWLAREARGNDINLQPWIESGPWGILELANKYLPEELRKRLSEIRSN